VPFNTYKHKKTLEQNHLKSAILLKMLATTIQLSKHHTPPPRWSDTHHPPTEGLARVLPQDPIVCRQFLLSQTRPFVVAHQADTHYRRPAPHGSHPHHLGMSLVVLLRKEVIQPHLPVRLPCYDFVPIADPTFDSSPHKG
jgi:hypothetical protein